MRILITAGGTREYIDPVRFISNASSGKMGYALAEAALVAGHKVILISASDLQPPIGIDFVGVESAEDMFNAVKKFFNRCDCLIMAAAVADYTPASPARTKIKKSGKALTINLKPPADILKWAGKHKRGKGAKGQRGKDKIVVGFALDDKDLRARAEKKMQEKNLDIVIANTPTAIGAEKSTVQIKVPGRAWVRIKRSTKATIARRIVALVESISRRLC